MKILNRLLMTTFLVIISSTSVYANSPEKQFEQGLAAYNKQDYAKAFELWKPLAEKGYANIQYNLALMYEEGKGVKQDYIEAVKWYEKSAELGDAQSQFSLAIMYYKGLGVKQNYHQ
ncbi:Putative TPR repeat protein [Canicola haemoglobinophilus]|nr:tetratricopeptide repeat protein [Canicola haemoglobinophilus]STO59002.1 Putative TPR repeat protein [Canicola haemoglobinophilus]